MANLILLNLFMLSVLACAVKIRFVEGFNPQRNFPV